MGTLRMADSVTAASCPPGFDAYLGYINGLYPSYFKLAALYPNAIHITTTINAQAIADVLDVENEDATPAEAPGWATWMRSLGRIPTIYCSDAAVEEVVACFNAAKVALPFFLTAHYPWTAQQVADGVGQAFIDSIPGVVVVGTQWVDHGPYDESLIQDTWPTNIGESNMALTPQDEPVITAGVTTALTEACALPNGPIASLMAQFFNNQYLPLLKQILADEGADEALVLRVVSKLGA